MKIHKLELPEGCNRVVFEIGPLGVTKMTIDKSISEVTPPISRSAEHWEGCRIRMGQLNSIQLTKACKLKDMLEENPFVEVELPLPIEQPSTGNKFKCNCKRSKCLKLYCQCFAKKVFCNKDCVCVGCTNTEVNAKRLIVIRDDLPARKVSDEKGCRCQRSNCQKRYCECFHKGARCGTNCMCINCSNGAAQDLLEDTPSKDKERKNGKQRGKRRESRVKIEEDSLSEGI